MIRPTLCAYCRYFVKKECRSLDLKDGVCHGCPPVHVHYGWQRPEVGSDDVACHLGERHTDAT